MKQQNHLVERIVQAADLDGETLPKQPLIEVIGQRRVLIENHFGIIQYSNLEICVKVKYGYISICGKQLQIARMTKEQLVIMGSVECVRLCGGGR